MTLTAERWSRIRQIYESALGASLEHRADYLDTACGTDKALREEVDSLLRAEHLAADFLSRPIVDLQADPAAQLGELDRAGQTLGAYRLDALIGRGGMGEVYCAARADGQFERRVAIQLIRGGANAQLVLEHFRRERQILAALDHPHIAQLYDASATDNGIPYLVIEYVDGVPIDRYATEQNLSLRAMLRLYLDVCDAVQFAHQRLIVHRDLKPANILVSSNGDVKLLDFGVAKVLDHANRAEHTQTMLMTPAYASPEQIRGEAITTVSDVYSLGVLLYRLLTGCSPYNSDTTRPDSLAKEICEHEPPRFSTIMQGSMTAKRWSIPRDLEHITRHALRKLAADRYASVEQLAADIRNFLGGLPVTAAKGTTLYRVRKFVVRNRAAVGVAAAATLLTTAGVWEITRQRQIAERRFDDVRQLTNTVIFDVHDSIAELPGATPARKLILDRALQYLDRLERDNRSSLELKREIAAGYERIALVQGATSAANLGDLPSAETHHRRALALRQEIALGDQRNVADAVALARANRLLAAFEYSARANIAQALVLSQASLDATAPLTSIYPHDKALLAELAEGQLLRARVLGGVGIGNDARRPRDALQLLEQVGETLTRLAALAPDDFGVKRKSAIAAAMFANTSYRLGDRSAALLNFDKAHAVFAQLARQTEQTGDRRNAAFFAFRSGIVLLAHGEPIQSRDRCMAAASAARSLLAADPANKDILDIAINSDACVGHALSHLGLHRDATKQLERAVESYRLLAQEVSYEALPMSIAVVEAWHARALELSGDLPASRTTWERILKTYESVLAADPNNLDAAVNRTVVQGMLGHVTARLGDTRTAEHFFRSALHDAAQLREQQPDYLELDYVTAQASAGIGSIAGADGIGWYRKSLAAWARVNTPGRLTIAGFDLYSTPQEVADRLR